MSRRALPLIALLALAATARAQGLVRDINVVPQPNPDSSPTVHVVLGNVLYFTAATAAYSTKALLRRCAVSSSRCSTRQPLFRVQ